MPKARVLICDDNPVLFKSLTGYFEAENMEVLYASDGETALKTLRGGNVDLMVLDIMLPGISGTEVCLEVRRTSNIPILMLSAKGEEIDRIVGLEVGADDYVTKPFSPREVAIRCRKLLKRRMEAETERTYTLAELTVLPDSYEAYIAGQRVALASKEFEVLRYLISHAGRAMTREHIINAVWGYEYAGDPRIVDTLIKRLRQKLAAAVAEPVHFSISTVFGVGYKAEELP